MITFATGASASSIYTSRGATIVGFQFTTGWTAATLAFQASNDGINFGTVSDSAGEVKLTVPTYAANMVLILSETYAFTLGKLKHLILISGNSGSLVTQTSGATIIPLYGAF